MSKYKYFVSYNFKNDERSSGYGRAQVTRDKRITGILDVKAIEIEIEEKNDLKNVSVTNFILF